MTGIQSCSRGWPRHKLHACFSLFLPAADGIWQEISTVFETRLEDHLEMLLFFLWNEIQFQESEVLFPQCKTL